ncbi:GNAT family N-acetyltransferase [uncultured Zobellia sp.]|uniref:GNAT family N-acetyltransferase n=1 Tax=uncultured Zobellia sp. TaxID=255433 RepID=UPI002599687A|nr:GNAT family N-acetyltransferase [uncultured Zobellia sp.]
MKSFYTNRLEIKPTSEEDAAFILRLFNTPDWIKYIGDRNIHSKDAAKNYIQNKIKPQFNRLGFGNYTVVRKEDGVKLGSCGLYDRDGLKGIDIGFAFLPEYANQGYAFEASSKVLDLAFKEFHLNEIIAITGKDNLPSQRLLNKLGLSKTGTVILPNDTLELLLYSITNVSV